MSFKKNIPAICIAAIIAIVLAFHLSSCKKEAYIAPPAPPDTVSQADAAELVANAISPSTGGAIAQLTTSLAVFKSQVFQCGVRKDSTSSKTFADTLSPSYSYNLNFYYSLNCPSADSTAFDFNFTGTDTYNSRQMSSVDKSTGILVIKGLKDTTSSRYLIDVTYSRAGSTTSKLNNKFTLVSDTSKLLNNQYKFTGDLALKAENIAVDKVSSEIVSGVAAITVTATTRAGKTYIYNGSVIFLGARRANIVLAGGATYPVKWL